MLKIKWAIKKSLNLIGMIILFCMAIIVEKNILPLDTKPKDAGDLFLQYSNIAAHTQELKNRQKDVLNPYEYTSIDLMSAYESGAIKDFDADFDDYYSTLFTTEEKRSLLLNEIYLVFPFPNQSVPNIKTCLQSSEKFLCNSISSATLDARMASYVGKKEREKSEAWRARSLQSDFFSLSVWIEILLISSLFSVIAVSAKSLCKRLVK